MTAHSTSGTDAVRRGTDVLAVVAMVLAFAVPLLGALLAVHGGRDGGRLPRLRVASVVIGVAGTVMGTLVGIMLFGRENAFSR